MDQFFNNSKTSHISQEKLNFLTEFSKQSFSKDANQLASQLARASHLAKEKGLSFSSEETTLLIELLKQQMSPEEQAKADKIIHLVNTFRPH